MYPAHYQDLNYLANTFSNQERTLSQIINNQAKLYTAPPNSYQIHVPDIVIKAFDHLCVLCEKGGFSVKEFFISFTDNHISGVTWNQTDEDNLSNLKAQYNKRQEVFVGLNEPRYIIQLFLDFLESLSEPVIYKHFFLDFPEVLQDDEGRRGFFEGTNPKLRQIEEPIYHLLCYICKSVSALTRKNIDKYRELVIAMLFRVSIALRQDLKRVNNYFMKRDVIAKKAFISEAMADPLTLLLYQWSREYDEKFRDAFFITVSPMPKLHSKIVNNRGTISHGKENQFISKTMTRSEAKPKDTNMTLRAQESLESMGHLISEEARDLEIGNIDIDSLPPAIKEFLPLFKQMAYEEQNSLLKELNKIIAEGS
jgi:hypothetical protein